jgi:DNA-binding MarR family transcriptional regulator
MAAPTRRDAPEATAVTSGDSERRSPDAPISPDFFSTAGFALATADQVSTSLWRSIVEGSMTQPRFLVLTQLHHTPGIGHHELADRVGIDHATIGPTVRRLTDLELVQRHKDPADSRRAVLHATAAATSLVIRTAPLILELNTTHMAPLTPTESDAVTQSWSAIGDTRTDQWRSERTTPGPEISGIPRLADNPWFHLRRARRAYRRTWRDIIGDTTITQFSLLHVIARAPGRDIRATARIASVEETTALRVVMRLVRTRLARDPRDPNDARRSLLSLTPLGQEVHDAVLAQIPQVEQTISSWIPSQSVQELVRLTQAVARLPQRNPELS